MLAEPGGTKLRPIGGRRNPAGVKGAGGQGCGARGWRQGLGGPPGGTMLRPMGGRRGACRAWPGFETTRRAKLAARTASGRAAAPRHQHANKQENTSSTDGKRAAHGADGEQARRAGGSPHGLRDDAPSEARGADAERAGRRPQAPTRRQEREHELRGRQAGSSRRGRRTGSSQRGGRQAGSSRRGRRAGGPSGQLTTRTPSGRAERAAHSADAEQAGRRPGHQHAEHAHTTRPEPAAPNSAEDPGLVKQSDQAVHHEGGECFERSLDLALGQRGERCDSVIGPGARKFARLIEHVVGAQAFHNRGEGLVGG